MFQTFAEQLKDVPYGLRQLVLVIHILLVLFVDEMDPRIARLLAAKPHRLV